MKYKIVFNMVRCDTCQQVLLSLTRHDFRQCVCGTFTDGGTDYLHRGGDQPQTDLTIVLVDGKLRRLEDYSEQVLGKRE